MIFRTAFPGGAAAVDKLNLFVVLKNTEFGSKIVAL